MNDNNSNLQLLVIATISIIATFVFAYISYNLNLGKFPYSFISIWNNWDTPHYLSIARDWYSSSTFGEKHLLIAFFPLYPFLVKIFSFMFQNYLFSGLLISNISYIIAVFYLYKLVLLDFDKDVGFRSVIYLSIFPTAFFLHAAYTESLFIVLKLLAFTMQGATNGL